MSLIVEHMKSLEGQPVALICARYTYRGVVRRVDETAVLLSNALAVEVSGRATGERPQESDVIPSDLLIAVPAIEIVFQPTWAFHGEDDAK